MHTHEHLHIHIHYIYVNTHARDAWFGAHLCVGILVCTLVCACMSASVFDSCLSVSVCVCASPTRMFVHASLRHVFVCFFVAIVFPVAPRPEGCEHIAGFSLGRYTKWVGEHALGRHAKRVDRHRMWAAGAGAQLRKHPCQTHAQEGLPSWVMRRIALHGAPWIADRVLWMSEMAGLRISSMYCARSLPKLAGGAFRRLMRARDL